MKIIVGNLDYFAKRVVLYVPEKRVLFLVSPFLKSRSLL